MASNKVVERTARPERLFAGAGADVAGVWWLQFVAWIGLAGASIVTLFEAYLLERKFGFFRGGYLAGYHLEGRADTAAFLLASLLSDFLIVAFVSGAVLYIAAHARLRRAAATCLAVGLAVGPIVVDNFIAYELLRYLGDELNLPLLIALTGGAPSELIAVSNAHAFLPAMGIFTAIIVSGGLVWAINRHGPEAGLPSAPRLLNAPAMVGVYAIAAIVAICAIRVGSETMDFGMRRKSTGKIVGAVVAFATDVDRDGYGLFDRPPDPAPFNSVIRPYAIEIPGNGIDENGVGGDLPAGPEYREEGPPPSAWTAKPHIVFVMLESIRGDVIGARFGDRPVTPVLDQLAARGLSFGRMYSHNGFTAQSRYHALVGSLANLRGRTNLLDDFRANGYEVAFFSAQDETFGGPAVTIPPASADVFFHAADMPEKRFTRFSTPGSLALPFDVLENQVREFLDRRQPGKPLFLYVNFQDSHFPYGHAGIQSLVSNVRLAESEIQPNALDALRAMYLNTLANVDAAVGRVLSRTEERLGTTPAVIVTSDHGESLFEEGLLGHGYALNDAQTRIPLIVVGLPFTARTPMGQIDLRDAIGEALARQDTSRPGRISPATDGRVFQYLGLIDVPSQIGFQLPDGRLVYDFRQNQVRVADGPWLNAGSIDAATSKMYLELVHYWERLVLARERSRSRQ